MDNLLVAKHPRDSAKTHPFQIAMEAINRQKYKENNLIDPKIEKTLIVYKMKVMNEGYDDTHITVKLYKTSIALIGEIEL